MLAGGRAANAGVHRDRAMADMPDQLATPEYLLIRRAALASLAAVAFPLVAKAQEASPSPRVIDARSVRPNSCTRRFWVQASRGSWVCTS
jgi:hypothetical protein